MTMTETTFKVGDKVLVDHATYPGVWTVTKVNPKNLKLSQADRGRGLNAPKSMCIPAGDATDAPVASAVGIPMRSLPYLMPGTAVVYNGPPMKGVATGDHLVVLRDKDDRVNVTHLGGDDGRYWRMPPRHLSIAPNARIVSDA